MSLGLIIKQLLESHDISQKQMAEDLYISPSTLGNYIRCIREPDFKTLILFADYFNVSVDFLLEHKICKENSISQDEIMLLHLFRNMNDENKKNYLEIGKILIDKSKNKIK